MFFNSGEGEESLPARRDPQAQNTCEFFFGLRPLNVFLIVGFLIYEGDSV